ncbi:carbon-nitrogen hydrolase family protein [Marivivens aquimaris]|uniref:carbon-nitrogen hydrolase family protein n=1 Tax=Marivivens aquimaris TaxID=2774876 RepID=UPI00187E094F|nr:carbon-nitrogen hydrolase family protein [Marivivens aquimaris]
MKAALLQLTSSDDPLANLNKVSGMMEQAATSGAGFILTPEVTNMVSMSRSHQREHLQTEETDPVLAGLREKAAALGVWLAIGSLALKVEGEERFANRSFMIGPDGEIRARYDKIHMFDVEVSETEVYRESDGFRPGDHAEVCETPFGTVGLSICYDLRFPYLYRDLAKAGATIILIPAAFTPATGRAHWEPLLRARAIENGAYVLAAAQTGKHFAKVGKLRETYGHSMAISPWGDILADSGTDEGIVFIELDSGEVSKARNRIPSLTHDRSYRAPNE